MNFSIESAANPRIKELVKLRESPKRRKEHGLFFVEGISELKSLVNSGREIKEIYYSFRAIEKDEQNKVLIEFQNLGIQKYLVAYWIQQAILVFYCYLCIWHTQYHPHLVIRILEVRFSST